MQLAPLGTAVFRIKQEEPKKAKTAAPVEKKTTKKNTKKTKEA